MASITDYLTSDRDQEILALATAGKTYVVIAGEVGISKSRVGRILARLGYRRRDPLFNPMIPKNCALCGNPTHEGRKYCSRRCGGLARASAFKQCSYCGETVRRKARYERVFCNHSHKALWEWKQRRERESGTQRTSL